MSFRFFPGDMVVAANHRVGTGFQKNKYGTVLKVGAHGALVKLQWTDGGALPHPDETWFNFGKLDFAVYDEETSKWRTYKNRGDVSMSTKKQEKSAEKPNEKPSEQTQKTATAEEDIFEKMAARGIDPLDLFLQMGAKIIQKSHADFAHAKEVMDEAAASVKESEGVLLIAREHLKETEKAYEVAMQAQQNAEQQLAAARKLHAAASEKYAECGRKHADVQRRMGE